MMAACPVCGDRRHIVLPLMPDIVSSYWDDKNPLPPASEVSSSREYPCPECHGTRTSDDQVHLLRMHESVAQEHLAVMAQDVEKHVMGKMARALAHGLIEGGYMHFRKQDEAADDMRRVLYQGTVGIVHPTRAMALEQRVAQRQADLAIEVANRIKSQVGNWGSHYGAQSINKEIVYNLIGEALDQTIRYHRR